MANQKIDFRLVIETHYHARPDFNWARVAQFAGAEIFRRILGLAQLPLTASVEQKEAWLKFASGLVLNPLSTWKEIP
jgi:5-methylthioribose kinase